MIHLLSNLNIAEKSIVPAIRYRVITVTMYLLPQVIM
jgi:hypothetical protein